MLTTHDVLAVIGAIALLRLAWTTLAAKVRQVRVYHRPRLVPPDRPPPRLPPPTGGVPVVRPALLRVIHGIDPRDYATWPMRERMPGEPPC